MSVTDGELAARAGKGDREAFSTLVDNHQRKVYGLALQMLGNPHDAADASQEAFLRCYTSLDGFDNSRSFGAWIYRIAYNYCLDVLRQRKRMRIVPSHPNATASPLETTPDPGPGVEDLVVRSESENTVRSVFGDLSEEQQRILTLRYTLDLSYSAMAEVLGVPESTITMRLYHAKRSMRTLLKGQSGEDDNAP